MVADLDDLCGRMLGEFVLRERIDEGGFGAVYRCDQPLLGREAVVKVLHQRLRRHDVALQRFMREAKLASRLDHPYAAHVYAFGIEEDDGLLWIAMELVHGITLNRWLQTRGPLPLEQFLPFFERVAEVVQAAHERGIVHRDLKPSNMMVIERAGQLLPKLLDFGVAKLLDGAVLAEPPGAPAQLAPCGTMADQPSGDASPEITPVLTRSRTRSANAGTSKITTLTGAPTSPPGSGARIRLTGSDATVGSPPYMSPEQWDDAQTVGPASDLYALAIVAYEALTGRRPFHAATLEELDELHCYAPVPPVGGNFSPALDRVFQRALAKPPEDRYGSATELAAELREALMAHPREQLRSAAQQWQARAQSADLLLRGNAFAEVDRWTRRVPSGVLSEFEGSFIAASRRHARRAAWLRRSLIALAAVVALTGIQYRAVMHARIAEERARAAQQIAYASITQAEVEQGRQALLHDEPAEALLHLTKAYRRGDHSPGTMFMLARALQSRLAEQARFTSTFGRMWSATYSPDGRQIVTTDDRNAQIWDAASHRLRLTLPHGCEVYQALYSADGTTLVTAAQDAIRLWDTTTGALVRELTHQRSDGRSTDYYTVATSPDGKRVAALDAMGAEAHVWDTSTGALLAQLPNDASDFPALAFSADGRWLATTGGDDVRIFDTRTWTTQLTIAGPSIHALSWAPTSSRLVTAAASGDAAVWEIPSGARVRNLREGGEPVDWVAFSPNGALVVTATRDGAEQVWDTRSWALRTQGNPLRSKLQSIEFDATSRLVVAAGASGAVAVSDVTTGMTVAVLDGPSRPVRVAHFDPASLRVIGASWDGTARVWDASAPYRRWSSPPRSDDCGLVTSLVPDRRFIAIGCEDHATQIWDTARDRLVAELPSVTPAAGDFEPAFPAVSVEGDLAAIARGNTVEVYGLPGGRLLRTIAHGAPVSTVAFAETGRDLVSGAVDGSLLVTRDARAPIALPLASGPGGGIDTAAFLPDGKIVVADARRRLRVVDPDRAEILADLETPTRVGLLRASPDGRRLVTVPSYRAEAAPAALWDLQHVRLVAQLTGHVGQVFSARFVRGLIVTAGGDGTARVWDAVTGEPRQTYGGSARFLADATLSADGTLVIAGDADGTLRFWDAATARPLWTLRAHRSHVVGIHFEGDDIVTRGFGGDIARWRLPSPKALIEACGQDGEVAGSTGEPCAIVAR